MNTLSLAEAFAKYGASTPHRDTRLSAIAADGAIIVGCSARRFQRPARGVLRYEDNLSQDAAIPEGLRVSREHLDLALSGKLPVRLIVITDNDTLAGKTNRTIHVREDLVGSVVDFDGNRYVIDFVRMDK